VIETILKDSPVLQMLPFQEIVGNSLKYNRESTNPEPSFFDVGDTWTEATPTFSQHTATLKILGSDADVDQYLQRTRSNVNDLEAEVLALRSKAVRQKFDKTFVVGDSDVNAKEFDGVNELIVQDGPASQKVTNGANGAALTLEKMDELLDVVKTGRPDLILMSKRERRSLAKLAVRDVRGRARRRARRHRHQRDGRLEQRLRHDLRPDLRAERDLGPDRPRWPRGRGGRRAGGEGRAPLADQVVRDDRALQHAERGRDDRGAPGVARFTQGKRIHR
jgi:hypothetical protein